MIISELIERLTHILEKTGDVEVKMETGGFSTPITDIGYQGSDEENMTVFIK